jgi:hypothetical protein
MRQLNVFREQRGDAADDEEPCYPCMGRDNNIQGLPGAPDQVLPGETEDSFNPEGDVDSLSGEPGEPVDDFKTSPGEQPAEDAQGGRGPRPVRNNFSLLYFSVFFDEIVET